MPSNTLHTSIFKDEISLHGMTIFIADELLFYPTHNIIVPKHAELQGMEQKGISQSSLPKIYATDHICMWYGLKRRRSIRLGRDYCTDVFIES